MSDDHVRRGQPGAQRSGDRRWFVLGLAGVVVMVAAGVIAVAYTQGAPTDPPAAAGTAATTTATPPSASASATAKPSTSSKPRATPSQRSNGATAACTSTANLPGGKDNTGTCWPGPNNTGVPAGTTLTVVNHDVTVSTAGAVIDKQDIRGCLTVNAPGVKVINSKIHGTCGTDVVGHFVPAHDGNPSPAGAAPLTITDSEISCNNGPGTAVGDTNIVLTRVNIWGCENGGDLDGSITVTDSYIHDLWANSVSHTDGFQITEVGHNITFTHNSIDALTDATSAIISSPKSRNILVQHNLLGGGAYSLYCAQDAGSSYQAINNVFRRDAAYGPWTNCAGDTTSGNIWADTGKALGAF